MTAQILAICIFIGMFLLIILINLNGTTSHW